MDTWKDFSMEKRIDRIFDENEHIDKKLLVQQRMAKIQQSTQKTQQTTTIKMVMTRFFMIYSMTSNENLRTNVHNVPFLQMCNPSKGI